MQVLGASFSNMTGSDGGYASIPSGLGISPTASVSSKPVMSTNQLNINAAGGYLSVAQQPGYGTSYSRDYGSTVKSSATQGPPARKDAGYTAQGPGGQAAPQGTQSAAASYGTSTALSPNEEKTRNQLRQNYEPQLKKYPDSQLNELRTAVLKKTDWRGLPANQVQWIADLVESEYWARNTKKPATTTTTTATQKPATTTTTTATQKPAATTTTTATQKPAAAPSTPTAPAGPDKSTREGYRDWFRKELKAFSFDDIQAANVAAKAGKAWKNATAQQLSWVSDIIEGELTARLPKAAVDTRTPAEKLAEAEKKIAALNDADLAGLALAAQTGTGYKDASAQQVAEIAAIVQAEINRRTPVSQVAQTTQAVQAAVEQGVTSVPEAQYAVQVAVQEQAVVDAANKSQEQQSAEEKKKKTNTMVLVGGGIVAAGLIVWAMRRK